MIIEIIEKLPVPQKRIGEAFFFKSLEKSDNFYPINSSINELYDRVRMLDDDSYPNSFIEFGDLIFEFKNSKKLPKNQLICEVLIRGKYE